MKKLNVIILILILSLLIIPTKGKTIKTYKKTYLTPASEAGFESEALYKCVLDTLGENKTSATDEELAGITEVICRNSEIKSTKGIEKLTSLRYLNLYNNNVTSIDLSHNTALVMLNLTFNDVKSIDLSKNTNLQQLYLNGNKIENIDLSKNTKLIDLNVYNNKLSKIDITMLPELKFILLSLNNLTTIDLSNNNKLEHVYLSGNQLSEIKMPTNAANLTRLDLNANKLTNINLNTVPKLDYLIVSANKLSNLDLSKNTSLKYLYSSSNQLKSINLTNNTQLIDLDLYNNKLTSIDLSKLTNLKILNLSLNNLTSLDLSKNTLLERLYASSNKLKSLSLTNQTNLKHINAVFNDFKDYNIPNKDKIQVLTVDTRMIDSISEYTGITMLEVADYQKIKTSKSSMTIKELLEHIPTQVKIGNYKVYKSFKNVNNILNSYCESEVAYTTAGLNVDDEETKVNYCVSLPSDEVKTTTLNSNDTRVQVYSGDVKLNGFNENVRLTFDGFYEIEYSAKQVVKVPNTAAKLSKISIILALIVVAVGTIILVINSKTKNGQKNNC